MEARRRKRGEQIESYYYNKLPKARRCNISNKACVKYIITGLNYPEIMRTVSVPTYESPDEFHQNTSLFYWKIWCLIAPLALVRQQSMV